MCSSDLQNRSGKYQEALPGYEFVLRQPRNQFTEKSLLAAAAIQYRLKRFAEAAQRFDELEKSAEVKENISAARLGQLRSYDKLADCEHTLIAAGKIMEAEGVDKQIQGEAALLAARCNLKNGELLKAKSAFLELSKRTSSEVTAESKYSLALIEFRQEIGRAHV